MSLLGLPDELILNVVHQSRPLGFEALMLGCKQIYAVGSECIERHNSLRRKYRAFKFERQPVRMRIGRARDVEAECPKRTQSSLQLLHIIAKDRLVAEYIESINFTNEYTAGEYHARGLESWPAYLESETAVEDVRLLLSKSRCLEEAGIDPEVWLETTATGTATLLLSLLPNVTEINLGSHFTRHPDPDELNAALLNTVVMSARFSPSSPLAQVTSLKTSGQAHSEDRAELRLLNPFFLLPKLQRLRGSDFLACDSSMTGIPFEWRNGDLNSNIEEIEMSHSCITGSGPDLASLLPHAPKLRSFYYCFSPKWHECGHDWDAAAVFRTLERNCGGTLTRLSITMHHVYGTLKAGVCSLKHFTRLEYLEMDVRLFYGAPVNTEELQKMREEDHAAYTNKIGWTTADIPSLSDVLPPSMKTVRLITGFGTEEPAILEALFRNAGSMHESLPLLENVTVACGTSKVGDEYVKGKNRVHDEEAWRAAGDTIRAAGCSYEEVENVGPAWLEGLDPSRGPW